MKKNKIKVSDVANILEEIQILYITEMKNGSM